MERSNINSFVCKCNLMNYFVTVDEFSIQQQTEAFQPATKCIALAGPNVIFNKEERRVVESINQVRSYRLKAIKSSAKNSIRAASSNF